MISAQVLKHCRIMQSFLAWTNYNSDLIEIQSMLRFQLIEGNMKANHLSLISYESDLSKFDLLCVLHTVWPEILAGRYFGGLLKICHLAEFTLVVAEW